MTPAFFLLGFACLFCGLTASSFNLEDKTSIKNLEGFFHPRSSSIDQVKVITLPPIYLSSTRRPHITYPPQPTTPPPPQPTTTPTPETTTTPPPQPTTTSTPQPTTTSTPQPTTTSTPQPTTTPSPQTTTTTLRPTTERPFPSTTTTTARPTPNPYPPGFVKPQIYKNFVDFQGPLAGRLYNFVQNYQGVQNTKQRNEVMYNFRLAKAVQRRLEENDHE